MGIVLWRAFGIWCLSLTAQASLLPAHAQTQQPDSEASSCVSPEMARLMVQERDGGRVNSPSQRGNEAAAVRDNPRGSSPSKSPQTAETMTEAHKLYQTARRRGKAHARGD